MERVKSIGRAFLPAAIQAGAHVGQQYVRQKGYAKAADQRAKGNALAADLLDALTTSGTSSQVIDPLVARALQANAEAAAADRKIALEDPIDFPGSELVSSVGTIAAPIFKAHALSKIGEIGARQSAPVAAFVEDAIGRYKAGNDTKGGALRRRRAASRRRTVWRQVLGRRSSSMRRR